MKLSIDYIHRVDPILGSDASRISAVTQAQDRLIYMVSER